MAIGTALLTAGFATASLSQDIVVFDLAIILVGMGFTFAGNVPGVFWIAAWFERGAARAIGIYMMVGALGAACAPPVVERIVREGGWRLYWQVAAVAAALVGCACLALVGRRRIRPTEAQLAPSYHAAKPEQAPGAERWTTREAALSWQGLLIAGANIATMIAVTTTHSMIVPHLVSLGSNAATAALALGAISITATGVKAMAGYLCERYPPKRLIAIGLVSQAAGNLLLVVADTPALQFAAALAFGAGWGISIVAAMVLPLDLFGPVTGPRVLSVVALLTTFGAAGPIGAGWIADRFGTFAPIFVIFATFQVAVAIPIFAMRRPVPPPARQPEPGLAAVVEAV
jgi:MFS family permease